MNAYLCFLWGNMTAHEERKGVFFVFAAVVMSGSFPVFVQRGVQEIPPVMFAAMTALLAAAGTFVYVACEGSLKGDIDRRARFPLAMVTLCIVVIPSVLFFIGASKTSGINASLLLLSELIFTLLFTPFIGEKTTREKLVGALGVFFGAVFVSYSGEFLLRLGDMLVVLSTVSYPIGNF